MTIANVGLMSDADKAKIRQDVEKYEKNMAEVDAMRREILEVSRLMGVAGQSRIASGEAKIAAADSKAAFAKHNLILSAVAHAIGDHYKTSSNSPRLFTDEELGEARNKVEQFLVEHEKAKTPDLVEINMQDRCVKLLPGTAKLILEVLEDLDHHVLNLTQFKTDISPQAFNMILLSGMLKTVLFVEKIRGTEIENKAKQAGLRIFFENNGKVTESKLASMAISTSTSSSSSPIVTKNSGSSPDNSPPKTTQVGKPLPVPPPKALPKPPAPRNQPLEAK